uniref:Elongation of very long chain fatty acids protein n=1 Tax=Cacopsylla melanoneura TaxID=428564 RepID=A0A8D8R051_9HEMI
MVSGDTLVPSGQDSLFSVFTRFDERLSEFQDPRTKGFPLLQSTTFVLITTLVYLLIVLYAGPRYMANRKAIKLKTVIRAYNVMQICVCSYIVYQSFANDFSVSRALFTTCYPVSKDPADQKARNIITLFYVTYLIKLSELVETVFFVLRKKFNQVSGLHLYHHVSTLYIIWYAARYYPGGVALFPILLNSIVHIVMYAYYLVSNFGPKWQARMAPIKPYITIVQMAQFVLLIAMSFNLLSPFYCKEGPQGFCFVFAPNIVIVFFLFYRFFQRTYVATGHPTPLSKRTSSNKPAVNLISASQDQQQQSQQQQKQTNKKLQTDSNNNLKISQKQMNKKLQTDSNNNLKISQKKSSAPKAKKIQ